MDTSTAPQIIEHVRESLSFTPTDTKWVPGSARFVASGVSPKNKGIINMYQLEKGEAKMVGAVSELKHGVKCMTFGQSRLDDRQLAFGDYEGKLRIIDLENSVINGVTKSSFTVQAHKSIINAIDGVGGTPGRGAPEVVTGGRDGCARVWDPRVQHAVVSFEPEEGQSIRDCWSVAFGNSYNNDDRCIIAGYDNGDVKLFDLKTNSIRWEHNCANGITGIEFDRKDIEMNKLVITTLESKFRVYDMRTQHATDGFSHLIERAHKSTVWLAKHLPQNRDIFVTGGGNGGMNIYKYHYPSKRIGKHPKDSAPIGITGSAELLNSRVLSTQPVVSFDWSPDREGLCCMSCLDQSLR